MKMSSVIVLVCVVAAASSALAVSLPPYLKGCKRTDPDLSECFRNSVQAALPILIDGVKELDIPTLDPQGVKEVLLSKKSGGGKDINVDMKLQNVKLIGLKAVQLVPGTGIDLKNKNVKIIVRVPLMHFEGEYTAEGAVFQQPIQGAGNINMTSEYDIIYTSPMTVYVAEDGKQHVQYPAPVMELQARQFNIHLDNLFNGDKQLGDDMNNLLNKNWEAVLEEFRPALTEVCGQQVAHIVNGLAKSIPFDELFP